MNNLIPDGKTILEILKIDPNMITDIAPTWKRAEYRAVIQWVTKYESSPDDSNLNKVKGLIEASYHLSEAEEWLKSGLILFIRLNISTNETLQEQLNIWGYYQEQLEVYKRLLGKISADWDAICREGLGNATRAMGEWEDSRNYYKEQLSNVSKIIDPAIKIRSLIGLAHNFKYQSQYQQATSHYLQAFKIAFKNDNHKGLILVLGGLGSVLTCIGHYEIAFEYYQQQLTIATEINDDLEQAEALTNLGYICYFLKDYEQAMNYQKQSYELARKLEYKKLQVKALLYQGMIHHQQEKYQSAINNYGQALELISNRLKLEEAEVLEHLAISQRALEKDNLKMHQEKILEKFNQAKSIFDNCGDLTQKADTLNEIAITYYLLQDFDIAKNHCQQALQIAIDLQLPFLEVKYQKLLTNIMQQSEIIDVLIITALKDELDALKNCDDQAGNTWQERKDTLGYPTYRTTLTHNNGTQLKIVVARPVEMAEINTSGLATRLVSELKPRCLAMTGVCAGNKKDTFLGDVIVANRTFILDYGKLVAYYESNENQQIRIEDIFHDIRTYNLKRKWEFIIQEFCSDWLNTIQKKRPKSYFHQERWLLHKAYDSQQKLNPSLSPQNHPERAIECPDWREVIQRLREQKLLKKNAIELTQKAIKQIENERLEYLQEQHYKDPLNPKVHIGVIASGSNVQKDPQLFQRLEKVQRKTLGVEMEGAAIGAVAEIHEIPMIVVKGVQDYADPDKNDQFRAYAAEVSARFLLAFFTTSDALIGNS